MPTLAELQDALVNADKAGDTASAQMLADAIHSMGQVSAAAKPAVPSAPSTIQRASNAAAGVNYGLIPGIAGLPVDTVANVVDLAKAGVGSLYGAATGKTPPEILEPMDREKTFLSSQWIADKIRKIPGGTHLIDNQNPEDETSRLLHSGGIAAGGLLGGNRALGVPTSAAQVPVAVGSGMASQAVGERSESPELAILAGMLPGAAAAKAGQMSRTKQSSLAAEKMRNAERDETVRRATSEGYLIPPASVNPSAVNRVLESISGKAATAQAVSNKNTQVTDALARRAVGLPENQPLTAESMQNLRKQAFEQGYAPVEKAGQISTGRLYREDLNKIESQFQGASRSFPGAVRNDVSEMIAPLRRKSFDSGDAVKMIQVLRDEASKSFTGGDAQLGKAQRAAATAIEDQIERHVGASNPDMLKDFREARKLMAKTHTVEDAIKSGSGSVDPNSIAREYQKGAPLSGDLETIGRFANTFRKANQTPQVIGSEGVSKVAALASAMLGSGGAAAGGPALALLGASAPFLAPAAAKSILLSKTYQNRLLPNYKSGLLNRGMAQVDIPPEDLLLYSTLLANKKDK